MNVKGSDAVTGASLARGAGPVFDDLNKYAATMHFVGQSTILTLTNDRATGEAYTIAHHLTVEGCQSAAIIAMLRYNDSFVKTDGEWFLRNVCFTSTGSRSGALS